MHQRSWQESSSSESDESGPIPRIPPKPFEFTKPRRVLRLPAAATARDSADRLAVLDAHGVHLFDARGVHDRTLLEDKAKDIQ